MKLRPALLLSMIAASAHAAPNDPANCSLARWTSASGTVQTGTPLHSPSIRRFSEPCAMRTSTIGSFVTDASPNALPEYGSRFYFYPTTASSAPITIQSVLAGDGHSIYSARLNGSNLEIVSGGGAIATVPVRMTGWNSLELRWKAGSPGVLTYEVGYLQYVSPAWRTTLLTGTVTAGTAADRVESVQVGQIAGNAPIVLGIDAFKSRTAFGERIGRAIRGDANADGGVSGPDLVLVEREATGLGMSMGQPDCDEDGGVGGGDIVCVSRLMNGLDPQ